MTDHWKPTGWAFKSYLGAGANYTVFYSADKGKTVQGIAYQNRFAFAEIALATIIH